MAALRPRARMIPPAGAFGGGFGTGAAHTSAVRMIARRILIWSTPSIMQALQHLESYGRRSPNGSTAWVIKRNRLVRA